MRSAHRSRNGLALSEKPSNFMALPRGLSKVIVVKCLRNCGKQIRSIVFQGLTLRCFPLARPCQLSRSNLVPQALASAGEASTARPWDVPYITITMSTAICDGHIYRSADNATADVFVDGFLQWCTDVGEIGPMEWRHVTSLADEFADFANVLPISHMALSKSLSRRGLKSTLRYLRPDESGYLAARRKGVKRPRIRWTRLSPEVSEKFVEAA